MIVTVVMLILLGLLFSLLLLRLRLRCHFSDSERGLFVGLGRSGAELDWKSGGGQVRLFNLPIKRFTFEKETESQPKTKPSKATSVKLREKTRRERSFKSLIQVCRQSLAPIWRWTFRIVRGFRIEQLEGKITGGFESPDLTGQAFGYYCALLGAVPALSERFDYHPDWTERSFQADFKASVALPLYTLVGRTIQLIWGLPLRKIMKLAIGTKEAKGKQDVQ